MEGSDVPTEEEWLESLKAVMSDEDRALIDSIPSEGAFPEDADGSEYTPGFATVEDVMDYVNAMFEKKKEPDYIYVNAVRYAQDATPTSIYKMNAFEIDDEMLENGFEVLVGPEIIGFDGGANDPATIYAVIFAIDVPDGYEIEVHGWDGLAGKYFDAVDPVQVNPRYATTQYGSKTYYCYIRNNYDLYNDAYSTNVRYKILINKVD